MSPALLLRACILLLLLSLGLGCATEETAESRLEDLEAELPPFVAMTNPPELLESFAAAEQIRSLSSRDEAFRQICLDAAGCGQSELSHRALQQLKQLDLRDETAAQAALLLQRVGGRAEARAMAEKIRDLELRDAVFVHLTRASSRF